MAREPLTRAEFLRVLAAGTAGVVFLSGAQDALATLTGPDDALDRAALDGDSRDHPYMTVVHGTPIATNVKTAISKLGGMRRFVRSGDSVVIKPNICTSSAPEYGATTNPVVVATLVRLALAAGARRVRVMDNPYEATPSEAYSGSGIGAAVKAAGGAMHIMSSTRYVSYDIPGTLLKRQPIYRDMLECDVLINVPIAKNHPSAGLTLAGKNMMGATNDRFRFHDLGLSRCIAELNAKLKPDLIVLDAIRIMVTNGWEGGSLSDLRRKDTIIASKDWVAVDAYATRLFGKTPSFVPYIGEGAKMGLGRDDLWGLDTKVYEV
jgi:uncharacterized protein (DUF362 family)